MKKKTPKQPASETTKRPEPVGNGETAQGAPSQAANPSGEIGTAGKPDNAKRARPVFVDESDAAEMANFEPSPKMYTCACAFICDATNEAIFEGDNDLLSRDGIAEALGYVLNPDNAGTGAAALKEFSDKWEENRAERVERWRGVDMQTIREIFAVVFDEKARPDDGLIAQREYFLRTPHTGDNIRRLMALETKVEAQPNAEKWKPILDAMAESITGVYVYDRTGKEKPPAAKMRAQWCNDTLSFALSRLVKWLDIAALPDYADKVAELRRRIADNFGVFPAPFQQAVERDAVLLERDELWRLLYISRALSRKRAQAQTANGCEPVTVSAADRKPDADAADRDAAADRKPDADAANLTGALKDLTKTIQAANLTGAPVPKTGKKKPDISQEEMARMMGISKSAINNFENHPDRQPPPKIAETGEVYTAEVRSTKERAFIFAERYKRGKNERARIVTGERGAALADRQAGQDELTAYYADIRRED